MNCYYCGAPLGDAGFCPQCDADVRIWRKISGISNRLYNEGLEKARVRDLSGAVEYLRMSLRYNKFNIQARNLLGLVWLEMGEAVNAVSEWVISKSLAAEDNPATEYLADVQKSSARLENMNQTIKKFNQALSYCQQGSYDLAAIQLKKVLALNPRLVKAHQLNALLHMREGRYDLARRALKHAEKVDANNTNTLRYLKECERHLKANGKVKSSKNDTVTYQSGNDLIIRPPKLTDNTAVLTVVNLLIGAAIGIAVVCFLIIPGIRQRANTEATSQLVKANETISTREQTIKGLEEQIETLEKQVSDAKSDTDSADKKTGSYAALLDAYISFADKQYTEAGEKLENVSRKLLEQDGKEVYDEMLEQVQQTMLKNARDEAMKYYNRRDYEEAATYFRQLMELDESYEDYEPAYYYAYSFLNTGDRENARLWFEKVAENTSSGSLKRKAEDNIRQLDEEAGGGDSSDEDTGGGDGSDEDTGGDNSPDEE